MNLNVIEIGYNLISASGLINSFVLSLQLTMVRPQQTGLSIEVLVMLSTQSSSKRVQQVYTKVFRQMSLVLALRGVPIFYCKHSNLALI